MGFNIEHAESLRKSHEYDHLFEYCKKYENDPDAMAELSTCYFYGYGTKANYDMCFYYDLKAAHLGSSTGKANLAYNYLHGIGTETNHKTGLELLKQSIEDGCPKAVRFLGRCYELGLGVEKDETKAVELYGKAADIGDTESLVCLGNCYKYGIGVGKDETKAAKLYAKAADMGNPESLVCLGICYENGIGVNKDESKAFKLYTEAVNMGNTTGAKYLGACYAYGIGTERDVSKAAELYTNFGNDFALFSLGIFLSNGIRMEKDEAKAAEMYAKVITMKSDLADIALVLLGSCFEEGIGVERNEAKAVELYTRAADLENEGALVYLGLCYENGTGVAKDEGKAADLYAKAAKLGNVAAMRQLGICYEDGIGVKKDKSKALKLYNEASQQGDPEATYLLALCYRYSYGVKKSTAAATKLFKLLTTQHGQNKVKARAEIQLGLCYIDSQDTLQNLELALKCFSLAMENDDTIKVTAKILWSLTILGYSSYFSDQKYSALETINNLSENNEINYLNKIYCNNPTEKTARALLKLYQGVISPNYSKYARYRLWTSFNQFKLSIGSRLSERQRLKKSSFSLGDIRLLKEELNKVSVAMDMKDTLLAEKEQIIKTLMLEAVYQKDTLRSEQQKTQDILKKISDKIVTVEEGVGIIYNKTEQIQAQMNQLIYFAENDFQKWLQKEKEDIAPFIQNNNEGNNNEEVIAAFADKLANYLSIHIHGSDTLIEKETVNLQGIFGIIWDRLLPTTQTSLVSAGVLWSYCADIGNNFDYSGVCISATSALESELKRIFYTGFQEYLYNHYGDPSKLPMDTVFSVWPEKLLNKTKGACQNEFLNTGSFVLGIGNSFTLGTLPYLFWDKDPANRKLLQQRMKEYLQTIVKDCYADNPLKYINPLIKEGDKTIRDPNSFISQCEQIRENFRNPAAHIDIIPWEKADECYSEVVGKADSFRYAAQAKGLIMKLYEFLK